MARAKRTATKRAGVVDIAKSRTEKQAAEVAAAAAAKSDTTDVPKKKRRFRPGTVALREIRRYQQSTEPLIRLAPFVRLVRKLAQEQCDSLHLSMKSDLRFQRNALQLLREAAEMFVINTLHYTQLVAIRCKRCTIMQPDMQLVRHMLASENSLSYIEQGLPTYEHRTRSSGADAVATKLTMPLVVGRLKPTRVTAAAVAAAVADLPPPPSPTKVSAAETQTAALVEATRRLLSDD